MPPEQELPSQAAEVSSTPESLDSAVSSVSETAPKLSGLDRLKAQSEYVKQNDALPPKETKSSPAKDATGKFVKTAPAAEKPAGEVKVAPAPGAEAPAAAEGEAYVPNFKYKAQGKEFEIPEKYHSLITDKASEEEVKTLLGKAATVDEYKNQIETEKTNHRQTSENFQKMQGGAAYLRSCYAKGDFDKMFAAMNIPPDNVYKWVLDKVNYEKLPPEQKAQVDRERNLATQAEESQNRVSQVSQRELGLAVQVKGMQLDQTLGKADVKAMADTFDSKVGKPGAFRDAIIEHGKSVWALSNYRTDLTPEQAVQSFVEKYGLQALLGTPPVQTAAPGGAAAGAPAQPPVKVIPNVTGRSTSPIKQPVKRIEDYKTRLAELEAAEPRNPRDGYLAG